ncbi:hypothetical protein [Luteibaculum oceani]|uniref:HIRAN domain-containing protein n=1 Tax=Luteibaculum oceani TaxID=1294296 RepID=A0A5C6V9X7_9FLAO|nr:hypothetical protein [Luteibaculum oceani]TXC82007.1 hypothetical protein FRX97_02640 [Luteibaculum oceani]
MKAFIQNNPFFQSKNLFEVNYHVKREIPVLRLSEAQLPLIFRQLRVGSEVILKQFVAEGEIFVTVYYQGFKLGWLPKDVSSTLLNELKNGRVYRAVVSRVTKKRFLPPSQIFVNILSPMEHEGGQTCISFES